MKLAISFFLLHQSLFFSMCFYLMQTFFIAVEKTTNYFIILSEMRTESHHFVLCAMCSVKHVHLTSVLHYIPFESDGILFEYYFFMQRHGSNENLSLICVWVCIHIPFEILYPTIYIYTLCTHKRTEIRDKEKYYE